jgi:hypothetical protein
MNKVWEFLKAIPQAAQLVLVAAVVFLVTNVVTSNSSKSEIQSYIDKYKVFQAQTAQTVKMLDSVKKVIDRKDEEIVLYIVDANDARAEVARLKEAMPNPQVIAGLKTRIDSLKRATNDSVVLARTVIPAQDTLIKSQDSTIVVYKFSMLAKENENIALRKINGVLFSEKKILQTSLDSARTNLVDIPKPPENPDKFFFGLFKKPSRTQAFVGGVIATVIGDQAIKHFVIKTK